RGYLDQDIRQDRCSWVTMGPNLSRELVLLILQFLDEEKFSKTAHMLEKETGCYFDMKYFEDQVMAGEWDEVEHYLSGFTKIEDNRYSTKIFFEIRKQKYLEALDRKDRPEAVEILVKDLKVFNSFTDGIYQQLMQLITLENIRENEQLSTYRDSRSARKSMFLELRNLIGRNPQICDKLAFPHFQANRLRHLINQSLNWQHSNCKHQRPHPDIKTLFVDHSCRPLSGPQTPTSNSDLFGAIAQGTPYLPIATHAPFHHGAAPSGSNSLSPTGWVENPNLLLPHAVVSTGSANLFPPRNAAGFLKRPRTPPASNTGINYQYMASEHAVKRSRIGLADEATYSGPTRSSSMYSQDDIPMKVGRSFNLGSEVISLDFHPQLHTILLAGTSSGDIIIWDVGSGEKLAQETFRFWDVSNCTRKMEAALVVSEPAILVNRCIWSPDGEMVGVAFSKNIAHIYSYIGTGELKPQLEIDAHNGSVNDIAFDCYNKKPFVITCGDDRSIKVWDAITGHMQYIFKGHEAPVYCIFPHQKGNVQFIFSTATDGKIKVWLYDHLGSRLDYDAPGKCCTALAYSADGSRLFSCGTSKGGDSHLVEWNESDGAIKRSYSGFQKRSSGVVQFDTTRNKFLAAGDENQIKFWDVDNVNILTKTDIEEGCLEASPRLRFNKEGSLLAVTTKDNGIKILANADGLQLLRILKNGSFKGTRVPPEALVTEASIVSPVAVVNATIPLSGAMERLEKILPAVSMNMADNNRPADVEQRIQGEDANKIKNWKLAEASDSVHCRSSRLPDPTSTAKIVQLLYTNSGSDVLALDSNAAHKLWTWTRNEGNPTGKATATFLPQLRNPSESTTHDYRDLEKAISCMVLSNNDAFILSASGGAVSLLMMKSLKTLDTLLNPSPAATSFSFHPKDNNIIAFGLEDSTILINYIKLDKKMMLIGHQKKITGLAFSQVLNVLISSGADAKLCAWSMDSWEKQRENTVYPQEGRLPSPHGVTKIQFHKDQVHLLVLQESQIAIYDASRLELVCHWVTQDSMAAPISSATYSCDSQLVYAIFCDGIVRVFDADILRLCCCIRPSAFLPPGISSGNVYPLAIAAHPLEPNQFAIGLTDGGVYLIEPMESQGKWGEGSLENGAVSSDPTMSNHTSEML
ncbi:hypothetical protein KI387_004892, partial [Taxus chinensis]